LGENLRTYFDAENRALQALKKMKDKEFIFSGYAIQQFVRTAKHPSPQISELDHSEKIDLIVVLKHQTSGDVLTGVLQIKSQRRNFDNFLKEKRPVWCLLVMKHHSLTYVERMLSKFFKMIIQNRRNNRRFTRANIPLHLL